MIRSSSLILALAATGFAAEPAPPLPPKTSPREKIANDLISTQIKEGRDLFIKKQYVQALAKFRHALTLDPEHRQARLLAGLCCYWLKQPDVALEYWNALLDSAPRNSIEEWQIETQRVMALSAINQLEAAQQVVDRIYELRKALPQTRSVDGYVREHLYIGNLRAGCWEVFDDRKEIQEIWSYPVVQLDKPDEPLLKKISVESAPLPDGKPGFVLSEEGAGYLRIYKRWSARPEYTEVRSLVIQALQGKLKPLDENKRDNQDGFPAAQGTAEAKNAQPPAEKKRVVSAAELGDLKTIQTLGLSKTASQILSVCARLRSVQFDVTKLTRLSLSDQKMAEKYMQELNTQAPFAQEDAAELVDLISKCKAEDVKAVSDNLDKLGPRQSYLDYTLLTAFNTRGRDASEALLKEWLESKDFMVRQTAALLVARAGNKDGIASLIAEIDQSDLAAANVLSGSFEDLLGSVLPNSPGNEQGLAEWKKTISKWWEQNSAKLSFIPAPQPDQAYWTTQTRAKNKK